MNDDGTGNLVYNWDGGSLLQCSSSGNPTTVVSLNDENSIFRDTLDPRISVAENGEIRRPLVACPGQIDCYYTSRDGLLESQGGSVTSSVVQYPPDMLNIESVADVPCTSSASFASTVGPLAGYFQSSSHPVQGVNKMEDALTSQKGFSSCKRAREENVLDEDTSELAPHVKRQGKVPITTTHFQIGQFKADVILEKKDEKNDKPEQNTKATVHSKTIVKESKAAHKVNAQKDSRAKRGQATSAHSLAERLRRERINERMKFLQDLVPGCNKVTGKAVMLDEIINYVQSLQRQVEFLSMKLATVHPEMKVDIEKLSLQDIHSSQDGTAALPGSGSAVTSTYSIFPVDNQVQVTALDNLNLQASHGDMMSRLQNFHPHLILNEICTLSNPALRNPEQS